MSISSQAHEYSMFGQKEVTSMFWSQNLKKWWHAGSRS